MADLCCFKNRYVKLVAWVVYYLEPDEFKIYII